MRHRCPQTGHPKRDRARSDPSLRRSMSRHGSENALNRSSAAEDQSRVANWIEPGWRMSQRVTKPEESNKNPSSVMPRTIRQIHRRGHNSRRGPRPPTRAMIANACNFDGFEPRLPTIEEEASHRCLATWRRMQCAKLTQRYEPARLRCLAHEMFRNFGSSASRSPSRRD